jgi:hypothetical protein
MYATTVWVTVVHCTQISVLTLYHFKNTTDTAFTGVDSAHIVIGAVIGDIGIDTPDTGTADIGCAQVAVVALEARAVRVINTETIGTKFVQRTRISVVTGGGCVQCTAYTTVTYTNSARQ